MTLETVNVGFRLLRSAISNCKVGNAHLLLTVLLIIATTQATLQIGDPGKETTEIPLDFSTVEN